MKKLLFLTSISLDRVLSMLRPSGVINMVPLSTGSTKRRSLLMAGDDDECL